MEINKLIYVEKSNKMVFLYYFLIGIILSIFFIVALILYFIVSHNYYLVEGSSMAPTILGGEQGVYVDLNNKGAYGDIIVSYNNSNTRIVKRLIAVGGDKVGYYHNSEEGYYEVAVIYSGSNEVTILQEDYVDKSGNVTSYNRFISSNLLDKDFEFIEYQSQIIQFLVIPEKSVYLLGDNRANSQDSSTYGAISESLILGKVVLISQEGILQIFDIIFYSFIGEKQY